MSNLSEDQYDQIAAHGQPSVTPNPVTWFRWGVIGAVLTWPFRRKRTMPQAPAPLLVMHPVLPEPTPPMEHVTVPEAHAMTPEQRIWAQAEEVVRDYLQRNPAADRATEPTLLLCASGLPMPFAPHNTDGAWRQDSRKRIAAEWQLCQMRNEQALTDALENGQTVYMDIVMRVPNVSEWRKLASNLNMLHAYSRRFLSLVQSELAMRDIHIVCTPVMDIVDAIAIHVQHPTWDVTMKLEGYGNQEASAA